MEEYKKSLFASICDLRDKTIEQVEERINNDPNYIINRNTDGKIHSRYLGDRYEPAIIWKNDYRIENYYLFNGDVKDCEHPFCIVYHDGEITDIIYYSSKRIKNGEPIHMTNDYTWYNNYIMKPILNGYESKSIPESNNLSEFTVLCDEMIEPFALKFAD